MEQEYTALVATISPIKMFDSAHARAQGFLNRGLGPKDRDDMRAAIVFAVAAIDAFFRRKIPDHLRKELVKTGFRFPESTLQLIREAVSTKNFSKSYTEVSENKDHKQLVDNICKTGGKSLIPFLEDALKRESFQGLGRIDDALRMMGHKPAEIWGKFNFSVKIPVVEKKVGAGRPIKKKVGRKIDLKTQMKRLFERRHLIVHDADLILTGKKSVGQERLIDFEEVKVWLTSSQKSIREINKIIS